MLPKRVRPDGIFMRAAAVAETGAGVPPADAKVPSTNGTGMKMALCFGALVAIWITLFFVRPEPLDRMALEAVYAGQIPHIKFLARQVGHIGAPEAVFMLTVCAGAYLALQGRFWRAPVPFVATVFAHATAALQRDAVGRPRPDGLAGLPDLNAPSFPPTRVVDPMTAYLLVALLLTNGGTGRNGRLIIAAAVLIGGSNGIVRVVLGHHWPSDALAGWTYGAAVAIAFYWLSTYLPARETKPLVD